MKTYYGLDSQNIEYNIECVDELKEDDQVTNGKIILVYKGTKEVKHKRYIEVIQVFRLVTNSPNSFTTLEELSKPFNKI